MRYLKRWFVSAGLPNPVYWRIVHGRLRYMSGWMPRVKGNSPGAPIMPEPPVASTSAGV
jgi:hypothetical protein